VLVAVIAGITARMVTVRLLGHPRS